MAVDLRVPLAAQRRPHFLPAALDRAICSPRLEAEQGRGAGARRDYDGLAHKSRGPPRRAKRDKAAVFASDAALDIALDRFASHW